jgi:hypothetical protein
VEICSDNPLTWRWEFGIYFTYDVRDDLVPVLALGSSKSHSRRFELESRRRTDLRDAYGFVWQKVKNDSIIGFLKSERLHDRDC